MIKTTRVRADGLDKMKLAGEQMSNLCYNLGQKKGHVLTDHECTLMLELCRKWDAARGLAAASL